jgi:hypothetical protein
VIPSVLVVHQPLPLHVPRRYPGKLTYRKSTREETIPTAETGLDGHGLRSFFDGADTADESQWVSVEGDFVHVLAIQTEWQSSEFKAGGFCVLNDGYIDLQWMMKGVGTGAVLKILLDEGSSEFVKKPFVQYVVSPASSADCLLSGFCSPECGF